MFVRVLDYIFAPKRVRRTVFVAILCLILLGASYADLAANRRQGFAWCLENEEACEGREILLPIWDVVALHAESYEVFKVTGPIPIVGNPEGLALGDSVSIRGHFSKDARAVVEVERAVHHQRFWKKMLAGLGLLLCGLGALLCVRIRGRRLRLRG